MNNTNTRQIIHKMIFGNDVGYYDTLQRKHPQRELFVSWNFNAALGNLGWCVYKRCYLNMLIFSFFGLMLVCLFICGMSMIIGENYFFYVNPYIVFYFVEFLLCGLFGDSAYLNSIATKIENLRKKGYADSEILKKCSPSGIMAGIFAGCVFVGLIVVMGITAAMYMNNL